MSQIKAYYKKIEYKARRLQVFLVRVLTKGLDWLGRFDARHPWPVIFFGILIAGGLAFGLLSAKFESRPLNLWVPQDIRSNIERKFYDKTFGPFFRVEQIITCAKDEGENALTQEVLLELLNITDVGF